MRTAPTDVEVSRALSHALRHDPTHYGVELDDEGWAPLAAVVEGLRRLDESWRDVDVARVARVVAESAKQRHEIVDGRIRAVHGHSVHVRRAAGGTPPPARLFHGTSPTAWERIRIQGLRPMGRQHVHLSADQETALAVGRRRSPSPVVLQVDARAASRAGQVFWEAASGVWLTDAVPAELVSLLEPAAAGPAPDLAADDRTRGDD